MKSFVRGASGWLGRQLRPAQPFLASFVMHALALVVLSLILLPMLPGGDLHNVFLATESDPLAEPATLAAASFAGASSADVELPALAALPEAGGLEVDGLISPGALQLELPDATTTVDREVEPLDSEPRANDGPRFKRWGPPRKPSDTSEVRAASSPAEALTTFTTAIQRELEDDDTLIVWLVDASLSLENDRDLMADHMEEFYRSIGALAANPKREGNLLVNAVVAFGMNAAELMRPSPWGGHVCGKLRDLPLDFTGAENVMTAVRQALYRYREDLRRRENMMIVIITDESGDDTLQLEQTIQFCRDYNVAVHVIGPSAVLGFDVGTQAWQDPATGYGYLLPVMRGPDTALPQRLWLPYWHESDLPPWQEQGARVAAGVPWYGGCYRERLISGFGPYALTRLALETGGSFTVLDREEDRSHYRLDDLRDYFPDYGSPLEYQAKLKRSRLRAVITRLSAMTMQKDVGAALLPPRMIFVGGRSRVYPFAPYPSYVAPTAFPQQLLTALAQEDRLVAEKLAILQNLLSAFDVRNVDWEKEYEKETSPRWRAWYDLAKGRLLASIVRCLEYRNACRELPLHLPAGVNHVTLRDAPKIVVPQSLPLADEAAQLLVRCKDNNPDTPWADLAQWELDKGLGIGYQAATLPPPPPVTSVARPTVVPTFPSL